MDPTTVECAKAQYEAARDRYYETKTREDYDAKDWCCQLWEEAQIREIENQKPPDAGIPASSQLTGVEARVCEDIAARQRVGLAKYGCTVEQSPDDMLRHAMHEAYDLSVYLRAEWERRQWQPIETAPESGAVLVCCNRLPDGKPYQSDVYQAWRNPQSIGGWERWTQGFPPTHWMPLPAPPDAR